METLKDIVVPNFSLKGKVAIITGGTKGLGYAMAVAFANYGADVVVASRTVPDCERVEKELKSIGVKALGVPVDVTKEESVENLMEKTVKELGKVDIMVSNAGSGYTARAVDTPLAEWNKVIDVDLTGVFLTARCAAKRMIKQGNGGRLINISSAAGIKGTLGLSAYCAAKAGVVNLTRVLAIELGRHKITSNAICPGYVPTAINAHKLADPKIREKIEKKTVLWRTGRMEEIAAAALFLASDYSGYMTGQQMIMDGGGSA